MSTLYGNNIIEHEKKIRKQCLLYEVLTETTYSTANCYIIP